MKKKFYWRKKDGVMIRVTNKTGRSANVKEQTKIAREILATSDFWNKMAKEDKESL